MLSETLFPPTTFPALRAKALAAIEGVDFCIGTEKIVRDLIAEAECCGSLHDALHNAGATVRDDGEEAVEDADSVYAKNVGYIMIGVGKLLIDIGTEAGRECDRERIRDQQRATLSHAVSLVMEAA